MVRNYSLVILLGVGFWQALWFAKIPQNKPLHFAMGKEYEVATYAEEVITFQGKDTALTHEVQLLSTEEGTPLLFYSNILTPVCIDHVCKPMAIEIYWNLLGAYVGYGVFSDELLTKYDHDLFENQDYEKLHQLLLNRHSILERRQLSDLFDAGAAPKKEKVTFKGQEVDAISGATKKEIKESVVEGALYSCYTIWHLVHGEVAPKMAHYLDSIYNEELANYFLYSDYQDYQLHAIKNFDSISIKQHLPRIIDIASDSKPLVSGYILKKLPKSLWRDQSTTEQLYLHFDGFDVNTKTILIDRLPLAHQKAPAILAPKVEHMSKNQLRRYLNFLKTVSDQNKELIWPILTEVVRKGTYSYSYLIEAFIGKT